IDGPASCDTPFVLVSGGQQLHPRSGRGVGTPRCISRSSTKRQRSTPRQASPGKPLQASLSRQASPDKPLQASASLPTSPVCCPYSSDQTESQGHILPRNELRSLAPAAAGAFLLPWLRTSAANVSASPERSIRPPTWRSGRSSAWLA